MSFINSSSMPFYLLCEVHKSKKLADNYKPKPYLFVEELVYNFQVTIPWGFHTCQQIVKKEERKLNFFQM